ncbi:MAG TPA: gamma-glutamyltransferase [Blastocatellia bacterium]|nr:gamma-glutamyltransferase [Blastocatellia bacterium]
MKKQSTVLALLLIAALTGCNRVPATSDASQEAKPPTTLAAAPTAGTSADQPVRARHGMVASTSPIASRVGVEVMQHGGNAIDAAVAVGLALAVTWPSAGNLGGGGFMMIRRANGETEIIDYRERAPLGASRDMYLDKDGNVIKDASTVGYKAIGVPGSVAGFALALQRHGKLKWADVIEPARQLAADGFEVSYHVARSLKASTDLLARFAESKRIFLRDGKSYEEGEKFVQPELAATLARLKAKGPREFYEGDTARMIVEDMQANGGLVTAQDLKEYEPTVRKPLHGTYRGYEILTMPPPSSGGVALIEMLNMLERYKLAEMEPNSSDAIHLMTEVERRAFADRAAYLGDTDFVKDVPLSGLMSKDYAADLIKTIKLDHATPSSEIREGKPVAYESPETTHFTVIDEEGNVVSNTYTLNNSFGSGVTARGTGFLLNNEMDDFTSKPGVPNAYGLLQSENNAIAPRKRPLSAMTPTIVLKDGKVLFAIGSPGGPTIINTVLQVMVNVLDFGMNLQQAIDAPRYHHQWMPDHIRWEPFGLNADTRKALEARGHKFADKPGYMGDAEGVMIDSQTGMRLGASDPRLGGSAVGY